MKDDKNPESSNTVRAGARFVIRALIGKLLDKLPYVGGLRKLAHESGAYPPGHFYSPVPSRSEILTYVESMRVSKPDPSEIRFNHQQQFELLEDFAKFYKD